MPPLTVVPDLLSERATESSRHVALAVEGGASLTYEDWKRRSNATARGLAARGVSPGDRVGLLFDNPWWTDYAVSYVAVQLAGAVAVPLSPRFTASELSHVIEHAEPRIIISPAELGRAGAFAPDDLAAGRDDSDYVAPSGPGDLAEIIYTSGTTGRPKGVAITQANLLAHDLPPAPPGKASLLHAFPVGTNAGQECLRMPLRRVTTAVVLPSFDPERLCAAVAERRIRRLQLVPSMAQLVVASGAPEHFDLSSVDRVTLSSAPAPAGLWDELAKAFPRAELFNAYALTESGGARTLMRHDPARPHAVGLPVGETQVRVVSEGADDVRAGATGEVWLRRPGAPRREYYRDPEATEAAFAGDWLRTGDLGFLDADGYLHLVDRSKDVIITGGLNVSSLEVEDALYEHPAVLEAAAFALPHPVLGQDVAAAVVLGAPADARELQAFVRARLAEHKVPHRVIVVDSLPRNASGKVVKRELRDRLAALPAAGQGPRPPAPARDEVQATVLAVWREVLGSDEIGVDDDFFDLGGHSLAAAQVVARLRDAFDLDLPVTAVFDHPSVAELAAVVAAGAPAASPS